MTGPWFRGEPQALQIRADLASPTAVQATSRPGSPSVEVAIESARCIIKLKSLFPAATDLQVDTALAHGCHDMRAAERWMSEHVGSSCESTSHCMQVSEADKTELQFSITAAMQDDLEALAEDLLLLGEETAAESVADWLHTLMCIISGDQAIRAIAQATALQKQLIGLELKQLLWASTDPITVVVDHLKQAAEGSVLSRLEQCHKPQKLLLEELADCKVQPTTAVKACSGQHCGDPVAEVTQRVQVTDRCIAAATASCQKANDEAHNAVVALADALILHDADKIASAELRATHAQTQAKETANAMTSFKNAKTTLEHVQLLQERCARIRNSDTIKATAQIEHMNKLDTDSWTDSQGQQLTKADLSTDAKVLNCMLRTTSRHKHSVHTVVKVEKSELDAADTSAGSRSAVEQKCLDLENQLQTKHLEMIEAELESEQKLTDLREIVRQETAQSMASEMRDYESRLSQLQGEAATAAEEAVVAKTKLATLETVMRQREVLHADSRIKQQMVQDEQVSQEEKLDAVLQILKTQSTQLFDAHKLHEQMIVMISAQWKQERDRLIQKINKLKSRKMELQDDLLWETADQAVFRKQMGDALETVTDAVPPVEKVVEVEKIVHVEKIVEVPVERVVVIEVEKVVEVPVEHTRECTVSSETYGSDETRKQKGEAFSHRSFVYPKTHLSPDLRAGYLEKVQIFETKSATAAVAVAVAAEDCTHDETISESSTATANNLLEDDDDILFIVDGMTADHEDCTCAKTASESATTTKMPGKSPSVTPQIGLCQL